jgi:hypothetical protein
MNTDQKKLEALIASRKTTIAHLAAMVVEKANSVDIKTADWGDAGDLGHLVEMLNRALGAE